MNNKYAVLSFSGGLDSSTLLLHLLRNYYNVICISFDYGQKHKLELNKAKELVDYLNQSNIRLYEDLNKQEFIEKYPLIKHQIIKLDGLSELLVSGLIDNNSMELKKGHYAHENALTSVVPNRNAIFASIIYAVALSTAKKYNTECLIALGTHMGDFDNNKKQGIYPDCSEEFKQALEYAFKIGNWDSDKINYFAPYNITDKTGVLKDGIDSCNELKIPYEEIYARTNTSYAPIKVLQQNPNIPGRIGPLSYYNWFSDYKSGSSIERIEAFINLNLKDPLQYAEDDGTLVTWDFVKNYVIEICENFKHKV